MRTRLTPITTGLALGLACLAGAPAAAQTTARAATQVRAQVEERIQERIQDQIQQRIVIPRELIDEINRVIDTAVGRDLARDLGRDLGRSMRDLARGLESARGAVYGVEQDRGFTSEQTDRQTRTLALGASGDLSLRNVVGDITVKTGSGRDVTVEIIRVSRGRTEADARTGLERVTAEVETRGSRGSVQTRYPDERRPNYSVSVAYNVTAPAGTSVSIQTITGDVRVTGIEGELTVNGTTGDITIASCRRLLSARAVSGSITLTDVQGEGRLEIGTISSDLRLSNVKAQRLSASVVSGSITASGVEADGASLSSMAGNIEFSGRVSPSGRYEFQAHSGDLRLGIQGGFDLEARTFSGRVQTEQGLGLTPGSSPRSLRGAVDQGGAAVVATTFSGNIWIGRKIG